MRILYAEDNEVNQALLARVVRARGWDILFRAQGKETLDTLAADPTIDLILLDIELADACSGFDVVGALRARGDRRPVVAITAYAMRGDRERILAAGCDGYLAKPLDIPALLSLLDGYASQAAMAPVQPPTRDTPKAEPLAARPPTVEAPPLNTLLEGPNAAPAQATPRPPAS